MHAPFHNVGGRVGIFNPTIITMIFNNLALLPTACLLSVMQIRVASVAYSQRSQCDIKEQPIVLLSRDPSSGNFTVVQRFCVGDETN
jgi:hypothetical protein